MGRGKINKNTHTRKMTHVTRVRFRAASQNPIGNINWQSYAFLGNAYHILTVPRNSYSSISVQYQSNISVEI